MILLMILIAYDILVLVDPTRCFFFNCDDAVVYLSNATDATNATGWPLRFTWPSYFQTNMNAKRIFQSIQLLCAGLFILFTSLYLLTYVIYRHILVDQRTVYNTSQSTYGNRTTTGRYTNYTPYNDHHTITAYTIESQPNSTPRYDYSASTPKDTPMTAYVMPRKPIGKAFPRSRANSASYNLLCSRCHDQPRLILRTRYEREHFYDNLCVNCNDELLHSSVKTPTRIFKHRRSWKP
jgi:hypothetical protein